MHKEADTEANHTTPSPAPLIPTFGIFHDAFGAVLSYASLARTNGGADPQSRLRAWAEVQVDPSQHAMLARVADPAWDHATPEVSVAAMLASFRTIGFITNIIEPMLHSAVEQLAAARLVRLVDPSKGSDSRFEVEPFAYRLSDGAYRRYLGSIQGVAEFWGHARSVVMLHSRRKVGVGSGFFVSPNRIITCRHVLDDLGDQDLQIEDEFGTRYGAREDGIRRHPTEGVDMGAITTVERFTGTPMPVGESPRVLDEVVVIGYPSVARVDSILLCHKGEITALTHSRYGNGPPIILLSCIVRPGNSGGPVVGRSGTVVGVVSENLHHEFGTDVNKALGVATVVPSEQMAAIL